MDEVLDDLAAIQQSTNDESPVRPLTGRVCTLRGLDRARRVNTQSQFAEHLPIRLAPGRCDYAQLFLEHLTLRLAGTTASETESKYRLTIFFGAAGHFLRIAIPHSPSMNTYITLTTAPMISRPATAAFCLSAPLLLSLFFLPKLSRVSCGVCVHSH
jgi:hypothetical protein